MLITVYYQEVVRHGWEQKKIYKTISLYTFIT